MNSVIYQTTFYCNLCKSNIPLQVYGNIDSSYPADKREEKEAVEWGEHYHWIDNHRRCAICGELVVGGKQKGPDQLTLVVNENQVEIHERYAKETLNQAHNGQLLIVHSGCVKIFLSESDD